MAADPDLALRGLTRLVDALPEEARPALRARCRRQRRHLGSRLLAVLGASAALADHLARHPEDWRALSGDQAAATSRHGRRGRPAGASVLAAVDGPVAARRARWTRCGSRTGAGCWRSRPGTWPARAASRTWPASSPTWPARRWSRPRRRATAELPPEATPVRLAVIAMGKCGGRELNYVSDVDVVFVAEPPTAATRSGAGRRPPRSPRRSMRVCSAQTGRGHDLAGRRGPAAGGPVRRSGPHAGQPPRLLRAVGADLGVPGAAQGAAGRRRPRARARLRRRARAAGVERRATAGLRRRRAGDAPPGRGEHPGPGRRPRAQARARRAAGRRVRGAAAAAGARPQRHLRAQPHRRWSRWSAVDRGYVGRDDAAELDRAYRFLRTLEHRLQLYRLRRTHVVPTDEADLRRSPGRWGSARDPAAELDGGVAPARPRGAPAAREALLPPAAERGRAAGPGRGPADAGGGPRAPGGARLRRPRRRAAAPRGADLRGQPAGGDPAHAAAGDARLVRRRRRPGRRAARLPAGLRRARHDALVPRRCCATREPPPSGWPACWRPAATPPTCCCGRRRRWRCSATTTS